MPQNNEPASTPMQTDEMRAREVLAAAYDEAGGAGADFIRRGNDNLWTGPALKVIASLLAAPPAVEREECPFCGSTDIGWTMLAGRKFAANYCQTCDARGPVVPFEMKREPIEETTAPAKAAWAKRASRPDEFRNVLRAIIEAHRSPEPYVSYEMDMPVPNDRRDEQFAIDVALLDKTYALSQTLHPSDREAIAAVIANVPIERFAKWAAEGTKYPNAYQSAIDDAYRKADAILALSGSLAPANPTEKGEL